MKKYFFVLFSLLSVLFFIQSNITFAQAFQDLSVEHAHRRGLQYLVDVGAMQGYEDGTIRPDASITRAEFLKILLEGTDHMRLGIGNEKNCFPDVMTEWFAPYVCYAYTQGLVKGYSDGLFHPERTINFVEAAKIIHIVFYDDLPSDEKFWYWDDDKTIVVVKF